MPNELSRLFGRQPASQGNALAQMRGRISAHRQQVDATLGGTTLQNRLAMIGATGVPVLSDVAGLAADAMGYANDPSSRTMGNYGLSALGLLPFLPGMTAYHGTPHRFAPEPDAPLGKFRMEKLGTGEGAQAYGHGMYFAESPDVAKSYVTLGHMKGNVATIGGKDISSVYDRLNNQASRMPIEKAQANYDKMALLENLMNNQTASEVLDYAKGNNYSPETIAWFQNEVMPNYQGSGSLYHVDIPDEQIDQMLDFDAPLSKQSEIVRNALKRRITEVKAIDGLDLGGGTRLRDNRRRQADPNQVQPWVMESTSGNGVSRFGLSQADVDRLVGAKDAQDLTGGQIYTRLAAEMGGQEQASAFLASLGIPGIRYFDGVSRKAGEGSRNFVVFEPDKLKILARE